MNFTDDVILHATLFSKFGGGSASVWEGLSMDGCTNLSILLFFLGVQLPVFSRSHFESLLLNQKMLFYSWCVLLTVAVC